MTEQALAQDYMTKVYSSVFQIMVELVKYCKLYAIEKVNLIRLFKLYM